MGMNYSTAQLYGGTYRLMRDVLPRMGITVRHAETSLENIESLVTRRASASTSKRHKPHVTTVDLRKAIAFAKKHKLVSIIDSTFATPSFRDPSHWIRYRRAQRHQSPFRAFPI